MRPVIAIIFNDPTSATPSGMPTGFTTVAFGCQPDGNGVTGTTFANLTAYVANSGSGSVSVIDGHVDTVATTIGVGTNPAGVGVDATTDLIYVANAGSASVSVSNGASNAVATTIAVGPQSESVAIDEPTNTIYVAFSVYVQLAA